MKAGPFVVGVAVVWLGLQSFLLGGCAAARPAFFDNRFGSGGFRTHEMTIAERLYRYAVFEPNVAPPPGGYPAILFLHGLGESGTNGTKSTSVGLGPAVARRAAEFPFVVVFPQVRGGWEGEQKAAVALAALNDAAERLPIDSDRIALTGMSTGGEGVWHVAGRHPNRFAAAVPICGEGWSPAVEPIAAHMPVWMWHYAVDPIVPTFHSDNMARRLKRAGGDVEYDKPFGVGHDVWKKAYRDELFDWLLRQRRGERRAL